MFKRVLIANRGEIAVRIIRACRELGIETVAVYSDVDRNALHVRYADQAYPIGPAPARESYLSMDKLFDVARRSGADAVHPGYGFLAERAEFAQACAANGVAFIGPPASAIGAMGDKVTARKTVMAAGVPVVPGTDGGLSDDDLIEAGRHIGFPLMIKASAGGGGKGLRIVESLEQMRPALASARRESEAAFGEGDVFLEKAVEGARHIEFQILADMHGNVIHLGERECSIQRRHQKLLEESPSPFMDAVDPLRERMGQVAVRAAPAVGYVNAGTIEFLVDKQRNFYFLEMNTRLQVEHPVTEMVTGIDIVKEQIRIARGRKLRYTQADVRQNGAAMECRITAEDPLAGFLPSTGMITGLTTPTGPGVRVDSGVYEGFEITPYYDSMIAKLICWGETRAEALLRTRRALEEYRVMGLKTSIPVHQAILESFSFIAGAYDTNFVEHHFSVQLDALGEAHPEVAAVMAALSAHRQGRAAAQLIGGSHERDVSNWKWAGRFDRLRRL